MIFFIYFLVSYFMFLAVIIIFQMASPRILNENEIENILLETEDEEGILLGEEIEDEPDEIIQDFRLEEEHLSASANPDILESESDEEIEESLQSTIVPVTVLSVPEVLRRKSNKKQKNSETFV